MLCTTITVLIFIRKEVKREMGSDYFKIMDLATQILYSKSLVFVDFQDAIELTYSIQQLVRFTSNSIFRQSTYI